MAPVTPISIVAMPGTVPVRTVMSRWNRVHAGREIMGWCPLPGLLGLQASSEFRLAPQVTSKAGRQGVRIEHSKWFRKLCCCGPGSGLYVIHPLE
jgi:hypothetical protein